ncbi:MAG TPA: hypothetical protein VGM33_20100 [Baekduia sp.]|jgi:hypothetical protein
MPATRNVSASAPLIAGCLALAIGPRLPLITEGRNQCGWTCYTALRSPPSRERVVTAVDLWHLRPAFAIAIVLVALLGALTGWSGRGRRTAAILIALSLIALVVDALRVDGVATTLAGGVPHAAEPSPWVLVPVIGGLTAIAALLGVARGRASRSEPPPPAMPTAPGTKLVP